MYIIYIFYATMSLFWVFIFWNQHTFQFSNIVLFSFQIFFHFHLMYERTFHAASTSITLYSIEEHSHIILSIIHFSISILSSSSENVQILHIYHALLELSRLFFVVIGYLFDHTPSDSISLFTCKYHMSFSP